MLEIFMPKAGMDMQEGRVIRWLKEVGERVEKDEPIMEIETDKISMEAESPGSGVLLAKLVEDGAMVPVLQVIGYIGEAGEKVPEQAAVSSAGSAPEPAPTNDAAAPSATQNPVSAGKNVAATPLARAMAREMGVNLADVVPSGNRGEVVGRNVAATPLARRVAQGLGVDLTTVRGSGHDGKVRKDDVLNAAPDSQAVESERRPIVGARKVIGQRMLKSHTEIPPVTLHMKAYVDKLLSLRERINEGREKRVSVNDMMIKAVALAVREHPVARTRIEGDQLVVRNDVNIGFAVGMDEGLLVPVVKDADRLSLSAISAKARELTKKARENSLKPDDMKGSSFTISNMGVFDIYAFTPIINQPESAILGVCVVQEELALVNGEVVPRKYMILSLTFDHRIMDGTGAAAFQRRIKELIENPMEAML